MTVIELIAKLQKDVESRPEIKDLTVYHYTPNDPYYDFVQEIEAEFELVTLNEDRRITRFFSLMSLPDENVNGVVLK